MKKYLLSLLSASVGTLSSKRLCGIMGWIVCLGILIYCTLTKTQAPDVFEITIITSSGLLGLDTITNIWKKTKNKETNLSMEDGSDDLKNNIEDALKAGKTTQSITKQPRIQQKDVS